MISTLLLQPVLSDEAVEAAIGTVLGVPRRDYRVGVAPSGLMPLCMIDLSLTRFLLNTLLPIALQRYPYIKTSRDYATWLNRKNNVTSIALQYDYKMV